MRKNNIKMVEYIRNVAIKVIKFAWIFQAREKVQRRPCNNLYVNLTMGDCRILLVLLYTSILIMDAVNIVINIYQDLQKLHEPV